MIARTRVLQSLNQPLSLPWCSGDELLDLRAGCHVYLVDAGKPQLELLLTDVSREAWRDYWIVRFQARNEPGVIARAADFLHEQGINILQANAITSGDSHSVRLGVDCRKYRSPIDPPLKTRAWSQDVQLDHLRMGLELKLIDCLDFYGGSPSLQIRRNSELWKLHHQAAGSEISVDDQVALGMDRPLRIHHGGVKLPTQVLGTIRRRLATRFNVQSETLASPLLVESLDVACETLRIMVTFVELGILPLRIRFHNTEGAVARVTQWLWSQHYDLFSEQMITSANGKENLMLLMVRDLETQFTDLRAITSRLANACEHAERSILKDIDFSVIRLIETAESA